MQIHLRQDNIELFGSFRPHLSTSVGLLTLPLDGIDGAYGT